MIAGRAGALRAIQITDARTLPEPALLRRIEALAAYPLEARRRFAVMLRDPELPSRALLALGLRLRAATRAVGAALLVNDRLDLALLLGADGVHLGRRSVSVRDARALFGAEALVSVACHGVDDVLHAATNGADAALLSPIFPSPGKGPPLGPGALRAARNALDHAGFVGVSLWALGGVDVENAPACLAAGASGAAAIRADLSTLPAHLAT